MSVGAISWDTGWLLRFLVGCKNTPLYVGIWPFLASA